MTSVATPVPHDRIGTELVREWSPEGEARAVVVLVHGIAEHSGRYERTGDLFAAAGYHVRAFDVIGHGASGGDRVDIDDWSRFHDQIESHVSWAKELGVPVVLMGHSMGGLLALGYALDGRNEPDLLVLTAPALGGGAGWQRALAGPASRIAPKLSMPQGVKGEQLSRDPDVAEAYFSDPLVHTSATVRFGKAMFDAMDDAIAKGEQLAVPTLVLHGGADVLVPPQSSAFMAELPNCERRLYPTLRHEILNEPEGPEVVADIIKWVDTRI